MERTCRGCASCQPSPDVWLACAGVLRSCASSKCGYARAVCGFVHSAPGELLPSHWSGCHCSLQALQQQGSFSTLAPMPPRVAPSPRRTDVILRTWSAPSCHLCLAWQPATASTSTSFDILLKERQVCGCQHLHRHVVCQRLHRRLLVCRVPGLASALPHCVVVALAAARSGVNRYMTALLLQFITSERKLEALQASSRRLPGWRLGKGFSLRCPLQNRPGRWWHTLSSILQLTAGPVIPAGPAGC